jgi:membrane protein involved in colicin uptake
MSETSNNAKAKLEAARLKAEQLRLMQEEVARELAEAEALEAAQTREQEREKAKRETEALHRATEKERLRRVRLNKQGAAEVRTEQVAAEAAAGSDSTAVAQLATDEDWDAEDFEGDFEDDDASVGTRSSSGKSARKRLGLHCFNCNRYEGHYLSFYRRLWYSYVIGMTFGLAIVIGPYRCQCCGSSRLMMSNLLHPKYYIAVSRLRSKKRSRSSRRKSSRG